MLLRDETVEPRTRGALAELGITQLNTPLTPQKIWKAIREAKAG